jgi:hypothetical protein
VTRLARLILISAAVCSATFVSTCPSYAAVTIGAPDVTADSTTHLDCTLQGVPCPFAIVQDTIDGEYVTAPSGVITQVRLRRPGP